MGSITPYQPQGGASVALSNLATTSINTSLLPDTTNSHDLGSNSLRFKDGYFAGELTVWDLVVESGSSITLAGATFENQGHYTSVNTNWIVSNAGQDTSFLGVYAPNVDEHSHANLVLETIDSAFNIIKHSPLHAEEPGVVEIINEGTWVSLVEHSDEFQWGHYTTLSKDAYGNILSITGEQILLSLDNDHLTLDEVDLCIEDLTDPGTTVVKLSATEDCYINSGQGLGIGTATVPHAGIGHAIFAIDGPNAHADGPHIQYTTDADDYPVFQQMNWRHNDINFTFDAYYDAGWKSSDVTSNYRMFKNGDELRFDYSSGNAQGAAVAWSRGFDLDASGLFSIPNDLDVGGISTANDFFDSGDNISVTKLAKNIQTTGLISGIVTTKASSTTLDVSAGTGYVVDYSDPANPVVIPVTYAGVTGYTPVNLGTDGTFIIAIDSTGSLVELGTGFSSQEKRDHILVGIYIAKSGTILTAIDAPFNVGYDGMGSVSDFIRNVVGPANINGNVISANVGANLSIDTSAGTIYIIAGNFRNNPEVPDEIAIASGTAIPFVQVYRQASSSTQLSNTGPPTTFIDPDQWDDGTGVLASVTPNDYTVQVVYVAPNGSYWVAFGQEVFGTMANAETALLNGTLSFEEYPFELGIVRRSFLIVQEGTTDLTNSSDAKFFADGKFRVGGIAVTGGLTSPGGFDTNVQYNDAGVFGGSSDFTWDGSVLTVNGSPYFVYAGNQSLNIQATTDSQATVNLSSNGTQKGIMGYNEADYLVLAHSEAGVTKNSDGIRIKEGSVGIGATPASKLHVSGSEVTAHGNDACLTIENTATGGDSWYLRAGADGTDTPSGGFSIADTVGYHLKIDGSGRFGIGADPSAAYQLRVGTLPVYCSVGLDAPEVYNSTSILKIQPDANADVELFGDTDVDNADNGKMLYVRRQAAEGNSYLRYYISSTQVAYMHANCPLTLQAQQPFTINSVTDDINFKVGDNAGAKKVYFKDSDNTEVASVDSNGAAEFQNSVLVAGQDIPSTLTLERVDTIIGMGYAVASVVFKAGETTPSTVSEIRVSATEDWTATSSPTRMEFHTTAPGELSGTARMLLTELGCLSVGSNTQPGHTLDIDGGIGVADAIVFQDGSTKAFESNPFTWHIVNSRYRNTKDISAEVDGPCGIFFKPDGTRCFVVDNQLDTVFEYDLSVPWDTSTITYNSVSYATSGSTAPQGIFFRHDGRKMYLADPGDDEVNEYNLAVAWDLSFSVTLVGTMSLPATTLVGIFFRPDGRRMYVSDAASNDVKQYTLTIPWDVTTASWDQTYGTNIDAVEDLSFSSDGRKMFIIDGSAEDDLHEFRLTTPWDISTASLHSLFSLWRDTVPIGLAFSPDGSKMYFTGNANDSIYEYDVGVTIPRGSVTIGHDAQAGSSRLEVWDDDDHQIVAHDSRPQAADVGGGIVLGGHFTDAGALGLGSRIRASKVNGVSGDYGFDLSISVMENGDTLSERMRLFSDGGVQFVAERDNTLHLNRDSDSEDGSAMAKILFGCRTDPSLQQKGAIIFQRNASYGRGNLLFCVDGTASNSDADDGDAVLTLGSVTATFDVHTVLNEALTVNGDVEVTGRIGIGTDTPMEEFHIKSDHPTITFEEQDGASNEKVWEFGASGDEFIFKSANDSHTGTQTIFKASGRSGTSVTEFSIPNARVGIGVDGAAISAALEIQSTTGALLVSRMTTTQRSNLTAVNGMIIYDTTQNAFRKYENGAWASF